MIPRFLSLMVGIWLMAAPDALGYAGAGKINDQTCGPLIATFAITAFWEVTRGLRWMNFALGIWLTLAPVLFFEGSWAYIINSVACGVIVIIAARIPGQMTHSFNGGWRSLWR